MNTSPDASTATPCGLRPSRTTVSARALDPETRNAKPTPRTTSTAITPRVRRPAVTDIIERPVPICRADHFGWFPPWPSSARAALRSPNPLQHPVPTCTSVEDVSATTISELSRQILSKRHHEQPRPVDPSPLGRQRFGRHEPARSRCVTPAANWWCSSKRFVAVGWLQSGLQPGATSSAADSNMLRLLLGGRGLRRVEHSVLGGWGGQCLRAVWGCPRCGARRLRDAGVK
jgi:hypothetical protein